MLPTKAIQEDIIRWRRHLHENPELSYQEVQTSEFIYNTLKTFPGLEVSRPTKTSVVAILKGTKSANEQAKTILFRADIDALPIQEETDVEFRSKNKGVMHACGHDAHAAMLLGAAKVLASQQAEILGEIRFIFQHAEEVTPGGAQEIVKKGIADAVDYAFALHVSPDEQTGTICLRDGVFCAAADDFFIKVKGQGGHASTPEVTIDPVPIACEITLSMQQIVSRKLSVLKAPVISVTKINGGSATNVIPQEMNLAGTIRSLDSDARVKARQYVEEIVKGITETHRATYEIDWDLGYPSIHNDTKAVTISEEAIKSVCGEENIIYVDAPFFGTEDFSAFSQVVPSSMQFIGVHHEKLGTPYPLHHPKFKIDEDALSYGVAYFEQIAKQTVF